MHRSPHQQLLRISEGASDDQGCFSVFFDNLSNRWRIRSSTGGTVHEPLFEVAGFATKVQLIPPPLPSRVAVRNLPVSQQLISIHQNDMHDFRAVQDSVLMIRNLFAKSLPVDALLVGSSEVQPHHFVATKPYLCKRGPASPRDSYPFSSAEDPHGNLQLIIDRGRHLRTPDNVIKFMSAEFDCVCPSKIKPGDFVKLFVRFEMEPRIANVFWFNIVLESVVHSPGVRDITPSTTCTACCCSLKTAANDCRRKKLARESDHVLCL